MKKRWRRHGTTQIAGIILAWGCSVYQPSLLGDQAGVSSGGTGGAVVVAGGETGSGGKGDGRGGAQGTGNAGGGSGLGGSGGADSVTSAGESSTFAGDDAGGQAGEGGATACAPETRAAFCERIGKDCGAVDGIDNCGSPIEQANCGVCQGFKICGGGGEDNVCGALTDPAGGGTPTASSIMFAAEDGSKAFDLDANTKWYGGDGNSTGWLAYEFSGTTSRIVTSYSVTSANDVSQRDPAAWQLQGSNEGAVWVTVDQRSAQVFANRHQTNSYTCSSSTAYRAYRILIGTNNGSTALQLAELVLYGK